MRCRAGWLLLLVALGVGCTATPIPLPPPTGAPDGGLQRREAGAAADSGVGRDVKGTLDKPALDRPPTPFFDFAGGLPDAGPSPLDGMAGEGMVADGGARDATPKGEK